MISPVACGGGPELISRSIFAVEEREASTAPALNSPPRSPENMSCLPRCGNVEASWHILVDSAGVFPDYSRKV